MPEIGGRASVPDKQVPAQGILIIAIRQKQGTGQIQFAGRIRIGYRTDRNVYSCAGMDGFRKRTSRFPSLKTQDLNDGLD